MRYIIGGDGGGTKTDLLLCREDGICCGRMVVGASNHQTIGLTVAADTLLGGIGKLLESCHVLKSDLAFVCLGLSGADFDEDIRSLEQALSPLSAWVPCKVINDVWLPLEAMAPYGAGAVSICGTGHNTAVRKADGQLLKIAALTYQLGNWGGGNMLTDQAMHAALRAAEHTGRATALMQVLPSAYGEKDMLSLQKRFYDTHNLGFYDVPVPQIVSSLAEQGDDVCAELLNLNGRIQAEMTAGLISHAGLQDEPLPVVLAGSIYLRDSSGLMIRSYRDELHRRCPGSQVILLDTLPVVGAGLLALKEAGFLKEDSRENMTNWISMNRMDGAANE